MQLGALTTLLADTKNKPYVLEGSRRGKKVVVAPSLVGRVMGSAVDGNRGRVLGWINRSAIEKGMVDPVFNNVGGEERFWFCPEGGQFGLNFGRNINGWENYKVQDALSKQPFKVLAADKSSVVMRSRMDLVNASRTHFAVDVVRMIRILDACPYALGYGDQVDFVAFQSANLVRNVGQKPIQREKGSLGIWCLGQFLEHPRLVIIVPFRPGPRQQLGAPIREDYFRDFCIATGGKLPKNRWKVCADVALFKADGKVRGKIGVGRQRALSRLGSLDLDTNELIIVDYDFYPELEYAASYWRQLEDPYDGDAVSVYIDGPEIKGGPLGQSYELETLSPALLLQPGEAFIYRNRTFHMFGPTKVIDDICQRFLRATRPMLEELDSSS